MNPRTAQKRDGRRRRSGGWRVALRITAAIVGASAVAVLYLRFAPPLFTSFMLRAKLAAIMSGDALDIDYHWVGWRRISPHAALAVIAAEDQRFPVHRGFDFEAMQRAIEANRHDGKLRGASTITQQLAKNLFLWSGRSWIRKGLEAYFTVLLEPCCRSGAFSNCI